MLDVDEHRCWLFVCSQNPEMADHCLSTSPTIVQLLIDWKAMISQLYQHPLGVFELFPTSPTYRGWKDASTSGELGESGLEGSKMAQNHSGSSDNKEPHHK
jgi:hypothetical protein